MPWLQVTFMVEVDSAEAFDAEFDEDTVAAALPGGVAFLTSIEERPSFPESVRATWRRLRRSDP
jgi:hypothetical protein